MDDLMNLDLYELIGATPTATVKDIKTAYRKTALSCHPDKNPDNPRAAELFHQLSRALEILTDQSARDAYDKVLNARHQAKLRTRELDSKRKKLKEDLEAREEAFRRSQRSGDVRTNEEKLQAEIERLRKEGSKQVEEEKAFVQQQILEELRKMRSTFDQTNIDKPRIKIKWKSAKDDPENGGYNYETLHRILSKYGDIAVLVVSRKKKGSALVEYAEKEAAEMAIQIEQGLATNPITLEYLSEPEKKSKHNATNAPCNLPQRGTLLFPSTKSSNNAASNEFPSFSSAPNIFNVPRTISDAEFESSVLTNLRRAEERKRLIEELEQEKET